MRRFINKLEPQLDHGDHLTGREWTTYHLCQRKRDGLLSTHQQGRITMPRQPHVAQAIPTSPQVTKKWPLKFHRESSFSRPRGLLRMNFYSSLYNSEIFIIKVGADERQLSVHESVLLQSPVLRRICRGGFLESSTKRIELKDDDPEIFSKVITYLYRGDFEPLFPFASVAMDGGSWVDSTLWPGMSLSQRDAHAMESALVYTVAEKYQLERLKTTAVQKLKNLQPVSSRTFLILSLEVYSNVPESDTIFRDFFARYAPDQLKDASELALRPYLREGGLFAEDMFSALRSSVIAPDFKKTAMVS